MNPETIGGYRIVRKLGAGRRAEVFLGIPAGRGDDAGEHLVAVKVFRPEVSLDSVDNEIAALSRDEHPHVLKLRDLATRVDGTPCLIVERMSRGSLARLLEQRSHLAAGEAVTVLAPVAAALAALHTAGVAHAALGPSSILFRESGAPVLCGFGHATSFAAGASIAQLSAEPGVLDDYRALNQLALLVLDLVEGDPAAHLKRWLGDSLDSPPDLFADALGERVFELGTAEPVSFVADRGGRVSTVPGRVVSALREGGAASVKTDVEADVAAVTLGSWQHLPAPALDAGRDGVVRLSEPPVSIIDRLIAFTPPNQRELIHRLRAQLGAVRKPVWVTAGLVAVALAAVLAITAKPATEAQGVVPEVPTTTSPGAVPTGTPPSAPPGVVTAGTAASDDPIDALQALITTRNRCIRELSVLCLDNALQSGSAAMDDDAALIRGIQNGGEVPALASITTTEAELVERNGDAALISLGGDAPTSLLLVKGDAGWRIRDYVGT